MYILVICYIFLIFYLLINQNKFEEKLNNMLHMAEKFENISDVDTQSINNLLSIVNDNDIYMYGLETNELTINGKLTVNNGSEFRGREHYFMDEENVGYLKIGEVENNPGIFSPNEKQFVIGSGTNNVNIYNNLKVDKYFLRQIPKESPKAYDVPVVKQIQQIQIQPVYSYDNPKAKASPR